MCAFNAVQYIAYHTPTLAPFQPGTPSASSLIGKGLDPTAAALVQRFAGVLSFAATLKDIDKSATTLKVFVAPEFYFKGPGPKWGSFTVNQMTNILEALRNIGTPGPDWIVIAGSVVFYLPDASKDTTKNYKYADGTPLKDTDAVYSNVAPVLMGDKKLTYVLKNQVSNLDGPPQGNAISLSAVFKPLVDSWPQQKARFIFNTNRMLGLEICLDHATKELEKAIQAYPANQSGTAAPAIDLHVITSCGMMIKTPLARVGGYVMLCDGIGYGTNGGSEMRKIGSGGTSTQVDVAGSYPIPDTLKLVSTQTPIVQQKVVVYKMALL